MPRRGRLAVAAALRTRIVGALHVGRYVGGERLPGTRALAAELGVNERVVLAALRILADEGFVELRPRSGTYVRPPHPSDEQALPQLGAWLVSMLVQARARGLPPRQVPEYVRRALATRQLRAACIECNGDQLHLLCSELADDHGLATEPTEVGELAVPERSVALRRADVLVTTAFHAHEVEVAATRLGKPWFAVVLRPEIMRDVARRLREGPVYFVATDPRYEPKLRRMLAGARLENLRVCLVDRDDLARIPSDAPTYVMTSAREHVARRYGPRRGPGRPFHPPRSFSDASARELIAFIVKTNMAAPGASFATAAAR